MVKCQNQSCSRTALFYAKNKTKQKTKTKTKQKSKTTTTKKKTQYKHALNIIK